MYYSDLGPRMTSTLEAGSGTQGDGQHQPGVRARNRGGMGGELEYGTSNDGGKVQAQTMRAELKMAF